MSIFKCTRNYIYERNINEKKTNRQRPLLSKECFYESECVHVEEITYAKQSEMKK